ncbi:MAG: nucleoside deaminase [Geminicoccaceae bacterium]
MSQTQPTPMDIALAEAGLAAAAGEVPVGAVLLDGAGAVIARAHNRVERDRDPTAHAEMLVLRAAAARLGAKRLVDCTLYVSLEPCPMCAYAISLARLKRLVYAAEDPKGGGVDHGPRLFTSPACFHRPEVVSGIGATHSAALLRAFFSARR